MGIGLGKSRKLTLDPHQADLTVRPLSRHRYLSALGGDELIRFALGWKTSLFQRN
jgi:hypothetical protein